MSGGGGQVSVFRCQEVKGKSGKGGRGQGDKARKAGKARKGRSDDRRQTTDGR